jgi:hypothetical protein
MNFFKHFRNGDVAEIHRREGRRSQSFGSRQCPRSARARGFQLTAPFGAIRFASLTAGKLLVS